MKDPFEAREWQLAHGRTLTLGPKAVIMGILNITPDSFSDGGLLDGVDGALAHARQLVADGAEILDVGGESTRPGAEPVSDEEEQARVLPVIETIVSELDVTVSVDTYRAQTARLAVEAGAHVINDVWGFQKDPDMPSLAAETSAGLIAMHTGRERSRNEDVVLDQLAFLGQSITTLQSAGVDMQKLVLDPGFGFAKDPEENIALLARIEELHPLGYPIMVGTSRKRFIGHFTGRDTLERDIGTAATSVVARMKGCQLFRVHDVATNRDTLNIADAVLGASQP